jgi:hypothetical protein
MPKPVNDVGWHGLTFLAVHDRWRRREHQGQVRMPTIRSLARNGYADMYHNLTEAWIEPEGVLYLIENLKEIRIQYSIPDRSSRWIHGVKLQPRMAAERRQINAQLQALQEQQAAQNPGMEVIVRPLFVRQVLT